MHRILLRLFIYIILLLGAEKKMSKTLLEPKKRKKNTNKPKTQKKRKTKPIDIIPLLNEFIIEELCYLIREYCIFPNHTLFLSHPVLIAGCSSHNALLAIIKMRWTMKKGPHYQLQGVAMEEVKPKEISLMGTSSFTRNKDPIEIVPTKPKHFYDGEDDWEEPNTYFQGNDWFELWENQKTVTHWFDLGD